MGRRLNCRLPVHPDLLKPRTHSPGQYDVLVEKQKKSKLYYDRHSKVLPKLVPGDNVIVFDKNRRVRGQVLSQANTPRSYLVKNRMGVYRRNRRHLLKCKLDENPKK